MFEREILDLGFKEDIKDVSYNLEFDDMVFLYIRQGQTMYYEYYGKNRLSAIMHSETGRDQFINLIQEQKAIERNKKIDVVLSIQKPDSI